jgi:hypothetical protein
VAVSLVKKKKKQQTNKQKKGIAHANYRKPAKPAKTAKTAKPGGLLLVFHDCCMINMQIL